MAENAEVLLSELEQVLGLTTEEAVAVNSGPIEERAPKRAALGDTYQSIALLARSELESAYDYLYRQLGEARAPVRYVIMAFGEEERNPSRGQKLLESAKAELDKLLATYTSESDGQLYVPADPLLKILKNLMHPPWRRTIWELESDLATSIRLATSLRNAIAYAVARAHEGQNEEQIDKLVKLLLYMHRDYNSAFTPELRLRILWAKPSIKGIAALIFDSTEDMSERPFHIVAAATRLESPGREGALSILASALAVNILYTPGFGEQQIVAISQKLKRLTSGIVDLLFSKEKFEQLKAWTAKADLVRYAGKDIGGQLNDLSDRLTKLESIVTTGETGKYEREPRIRVLIDNLLEALREETTAPWGRPSYDADTTLVGNYCELLWENSIDQAIGPHGYPEHYKDWQWLRLRRSLTELRLSCGEGIRFSAYGWNA